MNDKHERDELQQALELDALLDSWMAGRSAAAKGETKLSAAEKTFAQQMVQLAQETEPDPAFVTRLENQLRWAARQGAAASRREAAPPRKLFWQTLMDALTGRRMVMTAGALALVAMLVIIAWPLINSPGTDISGEETRLALMPAVTPTQTEEAAIESLSVQDAAATPEEQGVTTTAPEILPSSTPEVIAAITPTPDPNSLPKLPIMGGGVGFGGGGAGGPGLGGGGDGTMMIPMEERLASAQFNLNAPLPTLPTTLTVYTYQQSDASIEQIQTVGAKFGFTGPVYYDSWYDRALNDPTITWPGLRPFAMFDGSRFFNVMGNSFSFFDNGVIPFNSTLQPMPQAQALPIALEYVTARNLLDFPYEIVKSPYGDEVAFYRLLNGVRMAIPELSLTIMEDGQILSAYTLSFSAYTPVGDYPLISPEEAWQKAQTTPDYQSVFVNLYPDPATIPAAPTPDPRYRSWYRTRQDGDEITLNTYVQVFRSLDPDVPVVLRANEYFVIGDGALLEQIAAAVDQNLNLTGTIVGNQVNNQSLLVTSFAVTEPILEWQNREGFIRRLPDGPVVLETTQGETWLIPNAPADLADGEHVNMSGPRLLPGDPYPVFDWTNADRIVEQEIIPEEVFDFPTPVPITQVNIDKVELIYYYTFVNDPEYDGPGQDWIQPAWRFSGMTDTGEIVEITVQATDPGFIQPVPTPMP